VNWQASMVAARKTTITDKTAFLLIYFSISPAYRMN